MMSGYTVTNICLLSMMLVVAIHSLEVAPMGLGRMAVDQSINRLTAVRHKVNKRQGLFSCSGWGAACTSGWRPMPVITQQRTHESQPRHHQPVHKPVYPKTRFWLTTERAWGPMGKRQMDASGTVARRPTTQNIHF